MFDRSTYLRLGRTLFAQVYGQIVTIAVQLALVPILLHFWGTSLYGSWLILSSIPFYLTFSDFGFTFIAKNEMLIAVAAGRYRDAIRTYHSIFLLLIIAAPILIAISIGVVILVDLSKLLSLSAIDAHSAGIILVLFVGNVLLYQYFLLICAGIRSENRPATEALWAANSRLGEGAGVVIAALLGFGPIGAAAAMVINRTIFLVAAHFWLRRASPWLPLGIRRANTAELKRLLPPALAYMCMPLAQAAMIQGPVLAIGAALGPVAVVTLSTSRTLARLGTSVTNMFNNSLVAEYSSLKGRHEPDRFRRLFSIQLGATAVAVIGYGTVILGFAQPVMHLFTHGKVQIIEPFFALVVCGVIAEMIWSALFTPVSAINRHQVITLFFLVMSAIGIVLAFPIARLYGLEGTASVVLIVNAAMVAVCAIIGRAAFSGAMPIRRPAAAE